MEFPTPLLTCSILHITSVRPQPPLVFKNKWRFLACAHLPSFYCYGRPVFRGWMAAVLSSLLLEFSSTCIPASCSPSAICPCAQPSSEAPFSDQFLWEACLLISLSVHLQWKVTSGSSYLSLSMWSPHLSSAAPWSMTVSLLSLRHRLLGLPQWKQVLSTFSSES